MPSRLLAAALLCAAIFAALLGAGAMAQDPAPTADPASVAAESGQTTIAAADAGTAGTESVAAGAATTATEAPAEDAATSTAAEAGAATTTADAAAPAQADATSTEAGAGEATAADAQAGATTAPDAEATTAAADAGDATPVDAGDATGTDAGAATDATTDPAQPDAATAEATAAAPPAATTTTDPAAAIPAGATAAPPTTATPAAPATSTPATSPTTAPAPSKPEVVGVTVKRSTRTSAPNTASGVAGCTGTGRLIGVVTSSGSTAASGCTRVQKTETPDATAPDDTAATPVAAEPTAPLQRADGTPTPANPTYTPALPGPAAIGVPNFFIDKFRIPPFLLPIYQAAGIQYGVRWEVLAAINEIETDYGRNLNISSAGALGWMQFMPATWQQFGVDANRDGLKDPFNPVDAIFAAARYLNAAGAKDDLRRAIFAYNHADWYVDSVLMRARVIGGLPDDLVGSLTGLTQGRFPVAGASTYAQELTQTQRRTVKGDNAAYVVESDERRRGIRIYGRGRTPVVAANDGRIVRIGESASLGRYVVLQDAYGNLYTYAQLGEVAGTYPALREKRPSRREIRRELGLLGGAKAPRTAASRTTEAEARRARERESRRPAVRTQPRVAAASAAPASAAAASAAAASGAASTVATAIAAKQRLFANPTRPNAQTAGGDEQLALIAADPMVVGGRKVDPKDYVLRPLKKGARVVAGTMLGRLARRTPGHAPHLRFEIRPAGRGAPRIDPKPILDGWKLLESTAIYRSAKRNPFFGGDAAKPSIGQILLMGKEALQRHVLANPRIQIYECGREDIRAGRIDRRVLATLEFLAASGLKPTVSSLLCGHGVYTTSGNVSQHSTGSAVDIAAVNGITISPATQGKGTITDITIQRLLSLQGTMKPDQIISLMTFAGTDNTLALSDHDDHIHVGWRPLFGANTKTARRIAAVLKPAQWVHLIERLGAIDNPEVREQPSKYAVKVVEPASRAHRTE